MWGWHGRRWAGRLAQPMPLSDHRHGPVAEPTASSRTVALTTAAMVAFAANSVLCRLALGQARIDAATFTAVRIVSGAFALLLLSAFTSRARRVLRGGSWVGASLLLLYALPFSLAYQHLPTGTGALLLFGAVQATMLAAALRSGERIEPTRWLGTALAFAGLVYLVLPGVSAPSPIGAALMATAGLGWGLYSLRGRGASSPLIATGGNFVRAMPLLFIGYLFEGRNVVCTADGLGLAVASGALASGLGYAVWYAALPRLSTSTAATVQLSVPVIAALGGVLWMGEVITARLVVASLLILGGVALALRR